jgi:hypothetical protein
MRRERLGEAIFDLVDGLSTARLFVIWLLLIFTCGAVFWLTTFTMHPGLREGGSHVRGNLQGLWTAIYFSFVTATSVGYGDVLPVGAARTLAVAEAVGGLLIFGLLIAKFVSYRQDIMVRQIRNITFHERLDRLQTNLHMVVSELLAIAAACDNGDARVPRIGLRLESTALVFAGELRGIHHLLYEPEQPPDESVLGAILANLLAALNTMGETLGCLPPGFSHTSTLERAVETVSGLAQEICGDCVPQAPAAELRILMDRIQQTAREITIGNAENHKIAV